MLCCYCSILSSRLPIPRGAIVWNDGGGRADSKGFCGDGEGDALKMITHPTVYLPNYLLDMANKSSSLGKIEVKVDITTANSP